MYTAKVLAVFGIFVILLDDIPMTQAGSIGEGECTSDADCKKLNSVCDVGTSTCVCLTGFRDQGQQCRLCQNKHECIALNYSADVRCFKFLCECKDGTNNCFPNCPDLTAPTNGSVTYDPDTKAGSTATFSCNTGFDSPTNPTRQCQLDGSWNDDTTPICTDIDECLANTDLCDDNATCFNTEGSYYCQCNEGYEGNGTTCTDIDECLANADLCDDNATCFNTEGSYYCQCNEGYEGNGTTCTDVDECLANTDLCDDNATCFNTEGSYYCQCNDGYEGNGTTCTDVDECLANTDLCDDNATCFNTEGSYYCQCNDGYAGNGTTCTDVDECLANTDLCDDNATCFNTEGSYYCQCNEGYAGNGTTCTDVDECLANTDLCDDNATCFNTEGSYYCQCNEGYEGNGTTCTTMSDCKAYREQGFTTNGVYTIQLWSTGTTIEVYCDMLTDGGGWTVMQNRYDGSVDFYRGLLDYENGFGNLTGEFWLGLKYVQEMINQGPTELHLHVTRNDSTTFYRLFQNFVLGTDNLYVVNFDDGVGSPVIIGLEYHRGMCFSTPDRDCGGNNCPGHAHAGWWFNYCFAVNLNGPYMTPGVAAAVPGENYYGGITHYGFVGTYEALKASRMMFRRV